VLTDLILPLASVVAAEEGPEPDDVVAGWVGFAVFIGLILAVAVLGWSLSKQLKKADRAAELGLYDPSEKDERAASTNGNGDSTGPSGSSGSESD
jgi:hypothetical protein